jgi:hypothetical protein
MRPSNLPGSVALCKNLDSVAIAPQLLEEIQPVPAGCTDGPRGMCIPPLASVASAELFSLSRAQRARAPCDQLGSFPVVNRVSSARETAMRSARLTAVAKKRGGPLFAEVRTQATITKTVR